MVRNMYCPVFIAPMVQLSSCRGYHNAPLPRFFPNLSLRNAGLRVVTRYVNPPFFMLRNSGHEYDSEIMSIIIWLFVW